MRYLENNYGFPVFSLRRKFIPKKQEVRSVELGVYSMQLFHFWSRDVHPVQNLLLCTKFHKNRMIFHWDMAIYRFSKWQPSAILELFCHYTRPPTKSVAGRSCLSNFMSIWYTDLNYYLIWKLFEFFAYLAWNAYSGPQNGGFEDFGPINVIIHHRNP